MEYQRPLDSSTYSIMDSNYSTVKPKPRLHAQVIYKFSSSEKFFLCMRALWFAPSVFIIVLLGTVSHSLVSYIADENDFISSTEWTSTIVLTSFMWSAITSLSIDTCLHFIVSMKLLGSILHGTLPFKNSKGLRLWVNFVGLFLFLDCTALVFVPVTLKTMTGWAILTIPATRLISLLSLVVYIIKIDKFNYTIKNDSQMALFVVSTRRSSVCY